MKKFLFVIVLILSGCSNTSKENEVKEVATSGVYRNGKYIEQFRKERIVTKEESVFF